MADKFQLKAIISAVDKITPTLKGVQRAARLTNKSLRDIGRAGSKLMGSLGIPAGLAFGSVVYGAVRATTAVMNYAGSIQDASERTGASTTDYQVLANLMEQVGGSAEDAETSLTQFNKRISEAASGGNKNFAGLLKKLNIPLKDAQGNVRSLADMMPDLADAFEKNTSPALRTRMSMELFGKSGSKLIPILTKGRDAYAEWAKEQERLGTIVSKDAIGGLDDMGDSIGVVGKQIKGLFTQSIAALAPVLMPIIKSLQEWIAANKDLIRTTITTVLTDIANALKNVNWGEFFLGIKDAILGVGSFIKMMGGMKNVLIALGVIWLAGPLAATFSLIGAVSRLGFAFGGMALKAIFASAEMMAFATHAAALSTGLTATLLTIAKSASLIAAAGAIGYAIGSLIYKGIEGTNLADKIGESIARVLAFFGNEDAKQALDINRRNEMVSSQTLARSGALAMAGGRQQLNGEMTVRFENAPAGMRVEPGRTSQPGVSMNPDVGYRTLGAGFAG